MVLKQTIGKGAKIGHGLGRNFQRIQRILSSMPKCNYHGIGYQVYDQGRSDRIQKKNRMTRPYLTFLSLSLTFRSEGYINTTPSGEEEGVVMPFRALTINVITKDGEEVENACPVVYLCPPDFKLDNWSIVEIPIAYKLTK